MTASVYYEGTFGPQNDLLLGCANQRQMNDQRYVCVLGVMILYLSTIFFLLISTVVFFAFNFILPKCNTV